MVQAFVPGGGAYGAPVQSAGQAGYAQQHGGGFGQPAEYGGQPGYGGAPAFQQGFQQPADMQQQYWQPQVANAPSTSSPSGVAASAPSGGDKAAAPVSAPAKPKAATVSAPAKKEAAPKKTAQSTAAQAPPKKKESAPKKEAEPEKPAPALKLAAEDMAKLDKREHMNIIFTGHVDAGKSTIGGHLMFLTGGVDARTLEKYEREAKEKNRESWYLSWALDTNEEERAKGKTVECGKATFHTEKKHYTIIDAPGHASFVPSMITGAAQADVAILVISARAGEFEAGFERGGQTREHAMLAKSVGVKQLVVVINKMDLCDWDEGRYEQCKKKLLPFLKACGFNPKTDITLMPLSGQQGVNLTKRIPEGVCPWYTGPSLVEFLDDMPKIKRFLDLPMRLPIADKYSDMGAIATGKLYSGVMKVGQKLTLMPNRTQVQVTQILVDDEENDVCQSGDSVKIKIKGVEAEALQPGYVLCQVDNYCSSVVQFDAQINVLEYKSIIAAGFQCMLHIHTVIEEIEVKLLIVYMNKKTGKPDKSKGRPRFMKQGDSVVCRMQCKSPVCLEAFKVNQQMGRFSLRDEGKTIAVGKVLKLIALEDSKAEAQAAAAAAAAD